MILHKPFRYTYRLFFLKIAMINIIVTFLMQFSPLLFKEFALTPVLTVHAHKYWQIITYQFLHSGTVHLFSNTIGLLWLGSAVEQKIGSFEFLFFYMLMAALCGITACILYYTIGLGFSSIIGASGAITALMYLFAVFFPHGTLFIFGIIPISAPLLIIGYAVLEFYDMFFTHDSIAHSVHLSGLVFSWLYARIRFKIKPTQLWKSV